MVSGVVRVLAQQFGGEKALFVMEMEFSGLHIALCHAVQVPAGPMGQEQLKLGNSKSKSLSESGIRR